MIDRVVECGPEVERRMVMAGPMGRLATPEEVVEVIAFLASEQAARVHGAVWTVDGGVTAG